MPAKSASGWYMNSLPLRFLFAPFRTVYVLFLIILTIFGLSFVTQTYFHQPSLLNQEIKQLEQLNTRSLLSDNPTTVNQTVSRTVYIGLGTAFFDWTGINRALQAQNESDAGYRFKSYLQTHREWLKHFDNTLKVIAIRLGNVSLFIGLALILNLLAITDGLVMRAVRQSNASRESAGIYHRAKYWRTGIIWISILLYLSLPVAISPYLLAIPIALCAWLSFLQAKFLKKYL